MMKQPDMFSGGRSTRGMVRRRDHLTSHAAAAGVNVTALQAKVLRLMFEVGGEVGDSLLVERGMAMGYSESTLRKRRTELVESGHVREGGTRLNARGRKEKVWYLTALGRHDAVVLTEG